MAYWPAMRLMCYAAGSPVAAIVLAHGAGAGQSSPFMIQAARGLAHRGLSSATFDFPYMASGRKMPDTAAVLENAWREAVAAAQRTWPGLPLVIGGKSMGGRIASHVAAQGCDGLAGLVFLGYPLHPPGRPHQRRDAHLPSIAEPMLFVQGSRDAFGTADEIRTLMSRLANASLHEVAGGDHSFKVAGRGAPGPERVMADVLDAVAAWMRCLPSRPC